MQRGMQEVHCFAKGCASDRRRGVLHFLDVVGRAPSGLVAQAGYPVPLMGTKGSDAAFGKLPYFVGRSRRRGFELSGLPGHGALLCVRHNGLRRI